MRTVVLAIALLVVGSVALAALPAAEAKQVCTSLVHNDCYNSLVCVYDRTSAEWKCTPSYYPPPCSIIC